MEPFDNDELTEQELDAILPDWKAPVAPARLRAALFPELRMPWWKRLWGASFRIPLPVAFVLVILLVAATWRWAIPRDVPVRNDLQPVKEISLRIIRNADFKN